MKKMSEVNKESDILSGSDTGAVENGVAKDNLVRLTDEVIEAENKVVTYEEDAPLPYPVREDSEEGEGNTSDKKRNGKNADGKNAVLLEFLDWVKTICIGVAVGVFLVVFVIQRNDVYGSSVEPTLMSDDVIFAEKISTYFANYDRGDIVILDGRGMEGYTHEEYLVKRIVGLPGETIRIADGVVYIRKPGETSFTVLDEPYLPAGTATTVSGTGIAYGYDEITLGENEYYCMGDNRGVSNDSRNLGPFEEKRIKGVGVVLAYPFSSFKFL